MQMAMILKFFTSLPTVISALPSHVYRFLQFLPVVSKPSFFYIWPILVLHLPKGMCHIPYLIYIFIVKKQKKDEHFNTLNLSK